ncbi:MAG: CatB-related O-acetyltransferase [Alphaproteobacteria bacterium]|nr:CatB-related O-acetyltransferase [Alphaproteobacteria bacterium]MBU1512968.1 CatB-related O-acetyltransferase [Alphaproteobacteria bacterium]MBU2094858.1 CatB-related O-acetyltransferase [Alphaproteobacteria bacterium]MBU2152764.1 CatB-related O-acetyltransferase [Alphaproteobacteria bacterium]MBU2306327.1 CatB-related O-acetyltransferase [Alphaproteobacteria bacterium]
MGLIGTLLERVKLRRLTRNPYENLELRQWFRDSFGVEVGLYSYGCFDRWRIPAGTRIGRYCSFSHTAQIINANHPSDAISTHPYLYEKNLGVIPQDQIHATGPIIEDDVWLSHNAIITPGCGHIGRGAIIGAGAVVTKDVPAYAIVGGVPAKVVRYRFTPEMQAAIEATRWWEKSKAELAEIARRDPDILLKPTVEKLAELAAGRP